MHIPCRDLISHLMPMCNYKQRKFNCANDLQIEIRYCLSMMDRFPIKLIKDYGNIKAKCLKPRRFLSTLTSSAESYNQSVYLWTIYIGLQILHDQKIMNVFGRITVPYHLFESTWRQWNITIIEPLVCHLPVVGDFEYNCPSVMT
jgi:hypothetical protein